MSVREELEALKSSHAGVKHLVFGDTSTGMVLFATAQTERSQEEHDAMVARGTNMLAVAGENFASIEPDNGVQIVSSDQDGIVMYLRAAGSPDEGLFLTLTPGVDVRAIGQSAAATLARIASQEV
ncbi:MAG: hypothetical protein GY947_12395 [Rhodobacteraceae bacterium]|nr:hypothetical protein [Paracoccaceae bacterium]